MKRALQLDSSGGGLPAARCSPDRIEHLSPPVKRAKLAGSGSPGVAAIVVSVQSTNAVSSASSVPPVAVRQCPSNVLPPSLVSGDIVTWLSSRMCSVVRMVSIGWKAFVGSRYDAGPNAADEFCIYRFSPRLLIFAPARNAGAYRKQDMHVYIRCPLRTVSRARSASRCHSCAAQPPRRRSPPSRAALTLRALFPSTRRSGWSAATCVSTAMGRTKRRATLRITARECMAALLATPSCRAARSSA